MSGILLSFIGVSSAAILIVDGSFSGAPMAVVAFGG